MSKQQERELQALLQRPRRSLSRSERARKAELLAMGGGKLPGSKRTKNNNSGVLRPQYGAPVSTSTNVTYGGSDIRVSGQDRMDDVTVLKETAKGTLVFNKLIEPAGLDRLNQLASAYQRIRYVSVEAKITPMTNTDNSGGWTAAIVADPSDSIVPSDTVEGRNATLKFLAGQSGAVTTKSWESSVIRAKFDPLQEFYTDNSEELRTYSPGRMMVALEGKLNADVDLVITFNWTVVLTSASAPRTATPEVDITLKNNYFVRKSHTGLWFLDGSTFKWDIEQQRPNLVVGERFALPSPVFILDDKSIFRTSDEIVVMPSGSPQTSLWFDFWDKGESSGAGQPLSVTMTADSATYISDTLVLYAGSVLKRVFVPQ